MSQKESEWEKELREMIDGIAAYQHNVGDRAVLLVKKVLSTREKEIAEEVERLRVIEIKTNGGTGELEERIKDEKNEVIDEVLQILKH